jgi:hypothetical protein
MSGLIEKLLILLSRTQINRWNVATKNAFLCVVVIQDLPLLLSELQSSEGVLFLGCHGVGFKTFGKESARNFSVVEPSIVLLAGGKKTIIRKSHFIGI